jgi:hypothetical protein
MKKPQRPPGSSLRLAKKTLEQTLLLDVTEQALAAASGTERYGFEISWGSGSVRR